MTQEEREIRRAKCDCKLKERRETFIAEKTSKNEPTLSDTSSKEDYIADIDVNEEMIMVEQAFLADKVDENDDEEECCVGFEDQVEKTKVNSQLSLSIVSNDENTSEVPPKMVSWEEFSQQMEDYKKLSSMFEQLVIVGKDLDEQNEKYKQALKERFKPYDADKEEEIKNLNIQLEQATLREEHLKEMLTKKGWRDQLSI